MTDLALKHGLSFSDLYERDGLIGLDRAFVAHLAATDVGLHARLMAGRAEPEALDRKAESDLLVDLAPHVEDFLGELFGIAGEVRALQARHDKAAPPGERLAAARRLRADRSRQRSRRCARPGELLHLVPQPGEGQLPQRSPRKGRQLQEERLWRDACRLPARREDLRDEPRQGARL